MKTINFTEFGPAIDVTECIETPAPAKPTGNKVTVEMLAMTINPADILTIEGEYGVKPPLPSCPGAEGVGRVIAIGEGVQRVAVGDLVLPIAGGAWCEQLQCSEKLLIPIPADTDIDQAAMIKANPATAEAMLALVDLQPGDWVIQNAANSAVGRFVIMSAKRKGLKIAAIVRRADVAAQLEEDGADVVLVADESSNPQDLVARLAAVAGEDRPKLALDAIGGYATNHLAACLADAGLIANYGLLSGAPCQVDAYDLVFRRITLTGFWLANWFMETPPDEVQTTYRELTKLIREGKISAQVEAKYPLSEIKAALAHAAQAGRNGKVLLVPDSK